jgi:predicted TIM-barrel fold metal-dependent hydrolase
VVDDLLLEEGGKRLVGAVEELGAEHLFFGSDYPHDDGHLDTVTKIKQVKDISDEVKEKIVGGNAISFMGGSLPPGLLR